MCAVNSAVELGAYVVRNYTHFMNLDEQDAYLLLREDEHVREPARSKAVRRLVSAGWEPFVVQVGGRILAEHETEVLLNRCPQCQRLASWTDSRQCRFCRHDWREPAARADEELYSYVLVYFPHLMTAVEWEAHVHLMSTSKASGGPTDLHAQAFARRHPLHARHLSTNPAALALASRGSAAFRAATARRILKDRAKDVFINRCPRCASLTRTPNSKQCRFCEADWHSLQPVETSNA